MLFFLSQNFHVPRSSVAGEIISVCSLPRMQVWLARAINEIKGTLEFVSPATVRASYLSMPHNPWNLSQEWRVPSVKVGPSAGVLQKEQKSVVLTRILVRFVKLTAGENDQGLLRSFRMLSAHSRFLRTPQNDAREWQPLLVNIHRVVENL
jgi:hypothetical protein